MMWLTQEAMIALNIGVLYITGINQYLQSQVKNQQYIIFFLYY